MPAARRSVLAAAFGLAGGLTGRGALQDASAADAPSVAELRAAGLDPLETYVRMFCSTTVGAQWCWWFTGALPADVAEIGAVDTLQEETVRVLRTDACGPGEAVLRWREVGVFRDIVSGEVPTAAYDPARGATQRPLAPLKGGPARVTVRTSAEGLSVVPEIPGNAVGAVSVDARIDGDRVCLTHVEDKTRIGGQAAATNRTVFKLYASLAELQSRRPAVAAEGFYGVRNLATGKVFVNGRTVKAPLDRKVNPIAWARLKAAHPTFFRDDVIAPPWDE
jgi:hypothetical protein